MSEDKGDDTEKDKNPREEGEEEALGRSFVADTPDEDPRYEATGTNTPKGDGDDGDGSEDSNSGSDE